MKAVVFNKKSKPDRLVVCEMDKPSPGDDEVLIKTFAVSLNAADYRSMQMGLIPKKKIFGADIAGTIVSVGKNVTKFREGDEVMGDLATYGFGGLAEYVTAPEKALILKPGRLTFEQAATLPMASMTALQALRDKAGIQKGQKVLIVGCAGGVGNFAVQLANYFGAEVTGVCSTKNVNQTLGLGATEVIDYTRQDFTKQDRQYDIILGINGNYPLLAYRQKLATNGTYVMVGGSLTQVFKSLLFGWLLSTRSKKMKSLAAKANLKDLEFLATLAEHGVLRPVIDSTYPLDKTAEAMNYLKLGHATGKVVIVINQEGSS